MDVILKTLSEEFKLTTKQVENVVNLIDEGNTIPFIARYRKEAHGALDDQVLREINDRLDYLRGLEKRKGEVKELINNLGALTEEIEKSINEAKTLTELDDIYRPFRPKRKTRASVAKEKGLEPLANLIFSQDINILDPLVSAKDYLNPEKEVLTCEDALKGAMDIIAENISDDASIRKHLRAISMRNAFIKTNAVDTEKDSVYSIYYDFYDKASKLTSHRVLAIDRGEKEGFLKVSVEVNKELLLNVICSMVLKNDSPCAELVKTAAQDSLDRLIFPSIEREIRSHLTKLACEQAIKVFSVNLRNLLMQPPVRGHVSIGLDPGFRTGCKVAVVDATGMVLDTCVIFPTHSQAKIDESKKIITDLIKKYNVEIIAIGNGTASKETEIFTANLISELKPSLNNRLSYIVVSEAGASVYSASKLAAEEFPDFDVTLRSAVSIARRLQDPLAELVKIDPKAIGVGQYQHDMPKKRLDEALNGVVEDCVNLVGVDLNTASPSLLTRISGITSKVSKNIVTYREQNGQFKSRAELKKVKNLGPKAFEQCAGFLRVPESENILDNTGVHPESYEATVKLLKLCGYTLSDVKNGNIQDINERVKNLDKETLFKELNIGDETLKDIITELLKPGRDPRDELSAPVLRTDILDMKDLKPGMELTGTVRNVIDFGAFIDIGVHQDGLVHISEICDKYIKRPSEVLKVGDIVKVSVLSVDPDKKRISLTMRKNNNNKISV